MYASFRPTGLPAVAPSLTGVAGLSRGRIPQAALDVLWTHYLTCCQLPTTRGSGHRFCARTGPTHFAGSIDRSENTARDGVLYQIDFDTPGMFAQAIGASVVPLSQLNARRTTANHSDCG